MWILGWERHKWNDFCPLTSSKERHVSKILLCMVFDNLTKAFDTVNREVLWKIWLQVSLTGKIRVMISLNEAKREYVRAQIHKQAYTRVHTRTYKQTYAQHIFKYYTSCLYSSVNWNSHWRKPLVSMKILNIRICKLIVAVLRSYWYSCCFCLCN